MLVIADDLTGAADTAGAFAASGHRCVVVLHGRHGDTQLKPGHHDLGGITIVDTNSRAMRDIDARHATAEVIDRFEPAELFVKIDSTLRGHIRSTVETALSAMDSPPARVVVCPAFPSHARTVANGRVHVRGTAIAGPSLHELFADLSGDIPMFVSDALTDDDLASIVATATTSPNTLGSTLWVGSAGLARHVGRLTPVLRTATPRPSGARHVVVVAGSRHVRTAEQLARLDPGTETIVLDPRHTAFRNRVEEAIRGADGLVLTGGATARAVLELLEVDTLLVGGEVEPGVPWCTAAGRSGTIGIVTKAGGFGDALTLRRAVRFLHPPE